MKKNLLTAVTLMAAFVMTLTACSEDKAESRLPVFDKVTVSPTSAAPGGKITATIYMKDSGENVKGTYAWRAGNVATGEVAINSAETQKSFDITIPTEATPGTVKLTVSATKMAAYAGETAYIDCSSMGNITTTFTVE